MIKKNNIRVYILQQNPKSGYSGIHFMLLTVIISRLLFCQSQHHYDVVNMSTLMLTMLLQTELEVLQKTKKSILKHSIDANLPLIMY